MLIAQFMQRCERILSEGQAFFRTGRITEEQDLASSKSENPDREV